MFQQSSASRKYYFERGDADHISLKSKLNSGDSTSSNDDDCLLLFRFLFRAWHMVLSLALE